MTNPYENLSVAELAYAAGVVDGEGCITIRLSSRVKAGRPSMVHALALAVSSIDKPLTDWLCERFGGYCSTRTPKRALKEVHTWRCESKTAANVLRVIRPYLLIKAAQADIALEFQAIIPPRGGRDNKLTWSALEARETYRVRIHSLNSTRGDQFVTLENHARRIGLDTAA